MRAARARLVGPGALAPPPSGLATAVPGPLSQPSRPVTQSPPYPNSFSLSLLPLYKFSCDCCDCCDNRVITSTCNCHNRHNRHNLRTAASRCHNLSQRVCEDLVMNPTPTLTLHIAPIPDTGLHFAAVPGYPGVYGRSRNDAIETYRRAVELARERLLSDRPGVEVVTIAADVPYTGTELAT